MITKEELDIITEALPYNGTKLIKEKLYRVSVNTISNVLNNPDLYREDIIDAALEVINDRRLKASEQKSKILELSTP